MPDTKDFVAQLPDQIIQLIRLGGKFGKDFSFEKEYIAMVFESEYFIHTRATLPLKDIEKGLGFGLWVRVSKQDFEFYLRAAKDQNLYRQVSIIGNLANTWPGFPGSFDGRVKVKVLYPNHKPYIIQYLSEPVDTSMKMALLASGEDSDTKGMLRQTVFEHLVELQNFYDYSLANGSQKIIE